MTESHQPLSMTMHRPPLWMLAALAFGLAPPVFSQLFDSQLAQANTWLVFVLGVDARGDIHLLRLLLRVLLPTLLVLAVLRFSPLGRWIVMTPLALGLLLIENALFLVSVFNQISMFVLNGDGVMRELMKGPAQPLAVGCLAMAVTLLVWATAWHRSASARHWLSRAHNAWLRAI